MTEHSPSGAGRPKSESDPLHLADSGFKGSKIKECSRNKTLPPKTDTIVPRNIASRECSWDSYRNDSLGSMDMPQLRKYPSPRGSSGILEPVIVSPSGRESFRSHLSSSQESLIPVLHRIDAKQSRELTEWISSSVVLSHAVSTTIYPHDNSSSGAIDVSMIRPVQKNLKRCFKCNKKHGVLGFKCKCGYFFCDVHRHASCHDCDYNFKEDEQRRLNDTLQKARVQKLPPI